MIINIYKSLSEIILLLSVHTMINIIKVFKNMLSTTLFF